MTFATSTAATSIGLFDVAVLGTSDADDYDFRGKNEDHYVKPVSATTGSWAVAATTI